MRWGEPRLTIDVDTVARMSELQLNALLDAYVRPEFYCPSRLGFRPIVRFVC